MIAEICNCHTKICVTQQDNFSNSFKNQRLIPLIIGVKKGKGFTSCQTSDVSVGCEYEPFCESQYRDS